MEQKGKGGKKGGESELDEPMPKATTGRGHRFTPAQKRREESREEVRRLRSEVADLREKLSASQAILNERNELKKQLRELERDYDVLQAQHGGQYAELHHLREKLQEFNELEDEAARRVAEARIRAERKEKALLQKQVEKKAEELQEAAKRRSVDLLEVSSEDPQPKRPRKETVIEDEVMQRARMLVEKEQKQTSNDRIRMKADKIIAGDQCQINQRSNFMLAGVNTAAASTGPGGHPMSI